MRNGYKAGFVLLVTLLLFAVGTHLYSNEDMWFQAMVYLALAQGINILYGFTGYLPFGYVGFFGTGAYAASLYMTDFHLNPIVAILGGGVTALIVGLLLSPLLRLSGAYFSIGSLAASQMIYYTVSNPALQAVTNGPYGMNLEAFYNPAESYTVMLVILAFTLAATAYLRYSRMGLALRATREDAVSAAMAGIPVVRMRITAWLLSATIAGLVGGAFAWHISVFYPNTVFDLNVSIFAIVFTLFGGGASLLGPIIGMVVLYGLYNWIGISAPQYFQLIYGVLIVMLVLFLPNGIMSLFRKKGYDVP
ncbi:branched-chain amino acid ABC transporter permease [Ferroacidibacillus organovorans]|uniref:Amino acid ABC transporter n=1 Tax=Ferroacidibacillus organovorans TaxID=1765683 RepID=A0A101XNR9_9BACL|nr:branched-chain amino acid ABC transporter permease [Ferroacidibacillus organovorans]KUO94689.1 amino acid ABC transporter [Ferroacidibacillus organovorans]